MIFAKKGIPTILEGDVKTLYDEILTVLQPYYITLVKIGGEENAYEVFTKLGQDAVKPCAVVGATNENK